MEQVAFRLPLREFDELRVSSGVWFLSRHSPLHLHYPPQVLDDRIRPALALGQFL